MASQGMESTYYSPDPEIVENVSRYNPQLYHFLSRERFIELLSSGLLRYSSSPPQEADAILVCGDTLRSPPSSVRNVENLVMRLSVLRKPEVIIFNILGRPGTSSRLLELLLHNMTGLTDGISHGYAGLIHRHSSLHPAYASDERAENLISKMTSGKTVALSSMEEAEAATITLLAIESATMAVHHQASRILGVQPPSIIRVETGWENESVLKLFADLETVHGKLLTHVRNYLGRLFMESCRAVGKRVREGFRSGRSAVNILCVSEEMETAQWVASYLPPRGCKLHTRDPVQVYEMVEVRGRLDLNYELVIVDGRLGRLAGLLRQRLGDDQVVILEGVIPSSKGV
jgi:hypothetical protein